MQAFWCQIFILPKKIVKEVEAFCRIFLWTGNTVNSKKALVAWEKLYLHKLVGGWNIKNIADWNKVSITKLMWALALKKDKLWVKWADGYYMKGQDPLSCRIPNPYSWALKKTFGCREIVYQVGGWKTLMLLLNSLLGRCKNQFRYNILKFHGEG